MGNVLGINFGHDGAAAVVLNGKLVSAVATERITRRKKEHGVTEQTINYVLSEAGITLEEIQVVAFSSYFYKGEHQNKNSYIKFFDIDGKIVTRNLAHLTSGKSYEEYIIEIGGVRKHAVLVQHHMAHAASGFYTSPFENAAIFSLDASGVHPEFCSLFAYGTGQFLNYFYCPGIMAGNVYSVFTERLGIGPGLTKAGTTMALAAFGEALPYTDDWEEDFMPWYERKFQGNDAIHTNYLWTKWTGLPPHLGFQNTNEPTTVVKNHAASLQLNFENILVKYAKRLFEETKNFNDGNLILTGGSFLNSDANMRIFRESGFRNIHLFPACGDDGTSAGAALYVAHMLLNLPRAIYNDSDYMYLGKSYDENNQEPNYERIAELLSKEKVVAWFQGRSEFGPRALGNRSFLADPRSNKMKDYINTEIKHRESYRPFAPAVLEEECSNWFDIPFQSKLMLFITKVLKPELIPAVCHVDNSARLQSVSKNDNLRFYNLLNQFNKITGVPVLLNTSLNDSDEPLVETPEDAHRLFERSKVDVLVVGSKIFEKTS